MNNKRKLSLRSYRVYPILTLPGYFSFLEIKKFLAKHKVFDSLLLILDRKGCDLFLLRTTTLQDGAPRMWRCSSMKDLLQKE